MGRQLVAILTIKRSAGVTPDVNFREPISYMPLPSANKAAHSGFETQRSQQKSKTGVSVAQKRAIHVPQFFFKKYFFTHCCQGALRTFLRAHPDIQMAWNETHFFCNYAEVLQGDGVLQKFDARIISSSNYHGKGKKFSYS